MGRRKGNKGRNQSRPQPKPPTPTAAPAAAGTQQATSTPPTSPQAPPSREAEVQAAESAAARQGLQPQPVVPPPKEDLDSLKARLAGVIDAYQVGVDGFDARELKLLEDEDGLANKAKALEQRTKKITAEREALAAERAEVAQARDDVDSSRAALKRQSMEAEAQRAELLAREEALVQREADADAGFLSRREEVLGALQAAHAELMGKNEALAGELEQARQAHGEALLERERDHRSRLSKLDLKAEVDRLALEQALTAREEALRLAEQKVQKARQGAAWAQEDADELKAMVQEHIEARALALKADLEADLGAEKERAQRLRDRCQTLEDQLEEHRAADRAISNESPLEVQNRLKTQEARIRELETELANRPSAAEADDLRELRDQQKRWEDERRTLVRDLAQARRQLETRNIDVDEVELLKDRNLALKENQRLLRAALDDLRADIDERLDKHREQPVFPELMEMDKDADLREETPRFYAPRSGELDLESLANDLQHRIGRDPDAEKPDLYYRIGDIRALLGGLAMSRLHLLQGISGIGKSSLPRRFAGAVGGLCETVSVQAGWRDRNDLLGYFNAFERRYYESTFVQALYKAQTPKYKNRLVLILLDEMNLSHMEQYGADVLDVLERRDRATRRFELMSARQKGDTPSGVQDGRFLPLPDNVWFVGTANHDETTKDFADKTYDRSFVLALPPRPDNSLRLKSSRPQSPMSLELLQAAFGKAQVDQAASAEQSMDWLTKKLATPMADFFGIGFGGRLETQAKLFIPVVCAAGGSLSEALDQMISTRVLRRIQGRHDLMEEDLRAVLQLLEGDWIDKSSAPTVSIKLVRRELKRLGADV